MARDDSSRGADPRQDESDTLVGWLYDVALRPEEIEDHSARWDRMSKPLFAKSDFTAPRVLDDPETEAHLIRASAVLEAVGIGGGDAAFEAALAPYGHMPAYALDGRLDILASNAAGRDAMPAPGTLPLATEDMPTLQASVARLMRGRPGQCAALRLEAPCSGRIMLLHLSRHDGPGGAPMVMAASSEIVWPDAFAEVLEQTFGLTESESGVLRDLVTHVSVQAVAAARDRSVETIRNQVKSVMSKTETRSQVELVRLAMSMMDLHGAVGPVERAEARPATGGGTLPDIPFRSLRDAAGRRIDYQVLGAENGRPVLYLSHDLAMTRLTAAAEAAAAQRGLRLVSPIRPGYGTTDAAPARGSYDEQLLADVLAIADAERMQGCPILSLGDDSYYALRLARMAPERFTSVLAWAGTLPITRFEQFDRMSRLHRFLVATAHYTPHILPFMARACFASARRVGAESFARAVFAGSPADLAALRDRQVVDAIATGTRVLLDRNGSSETAFTRQLGERRSADWIELAHDVSHRIPVEFHNGDEEPQAVPETLREWQRDFPDITFHIAQGAGFLRFFTHWPEVLDGLERHLSRADRP